MAVEFICESLCRVYLGWNFICSDYGRKFFAQLKFKQLKFKQLKFHSYRLWSQGGKIPKPRAFRFRDFTFIRNKKGR